MERAETRPASQRNCVPIRDAVVAGESVDLDHLITHRRVGRDGTI